nr:RNA-dependent RNA polymerase [Fusarium asiaticum mitovirus 8]
MKYKNLFQLFTKCNNIHLRTLTSKKIDVKYPEIWKKLILILDDFNHITEFMLYSRFQPSVKKNKKNNINLSKDLKSILNINEPVIDELKILDIIKLYKLFETFTLKGKYISEFEDLKLGSHKDISFRLFNNLPKLLLDVNSLEDNIKRVILQLIFSNIVIYRQFKVKAAPKFSSIEAPYIGEPIKDLVSEYFNKNKISEWMKQMNIPTKNKFNLVAYSGNASSPNSKASSTNIITDLLAVCKDRKLWNAVIAISRQFENGQHFTRFLLEAEKAKIKFTSHHNISYKNIEEGKYNYIHSRLFNFTAPGGKFRVIANVDWISQSALSSIHFLLFDILSNIKSDHTFNHKDGLKIYDPSADSYYSIDLSAATDRMPRLIQAELIRGLFNHQEKKNGDLIAEQWLEIVDRKYYTTNSLINNEIPVRYSVGQGMGLFTSWPIMAFTHHYIVNCLCGIPLSDYSIVGDDLLIKNNKDGYHKYLEIMKKLGMEVNLDKTIVSENTKQHSLEFARNYIISGVKVIANPWGVLFAWNSNKVSYETFLWAFKEIITPESSLMFLNEFDIKMKDEKWIIHLFFLFKTKILTFKELSKLDEFKPIPGWFEANLLTKFIFDIGPEAIPRMTLEDKAFTETLSSQLSVRSDEELANLDRVYKSMLGIAFSKYPIQDITRKFIERLHSAQITSIDYDIDSVPTIKSKEKRLLIEMYNFKRSNN